MLLHCGQARIWLLQKYFHNKPIYNISFLLEVKGKLNLELLEKSVNFLIIKHKVLRSNINCIDGNPHLIFNNYKLMIKKYIGKNIDIDTESFQIENEPFDLENDLLLRIAYFENQKRKNLLFCFSDLVIDGKSVLCFFDKLINIYQNFLKKIIPKVPVYPYYDIINNNKYNENYQFWKQKLRKKCHIDFPIQYNRFSKKENRIKYIIDGLFRNKIVNYFKKHNVTIFQLFQSAVFVLLYKYSNQNYLNIDTIMDCIDNNKSIGLFNNTVIIPFNFEDKLNLSCTKYLQEIRNLNRNILANRCVPLEKICDNLDLKSLPNIRLHFEYKPKITHVDLGESQLYSNFFENSSNSIRQLLIFNVGEIDNKLDCYISYKKDCYDVDAIQEMIINLKYILQTLIEKPNLIIKDLLSSINISSKFDFTYQNVADYRLMAYKTAGKYPDINYNTFKEKMDTMLNVK